MRSASRGRGPTICSGIMRRTRWISSPGRRARSSPRTRCRVRSTPSSASRWTCRSSSSRRRVPSARWRCRSTMTARSERFSATSATLERTSRATTSSIDGKENKIDVSKVDVSMNGIELQDREFVAAIREKREPNRFAVVSRRSCPATGRLPSETRRLQLARACRSLPSSPRTTGANPMIIDCHGHYTTAPAVARGVAQAADRRDRRSVEGAFAVCARHLRRRDPDEPRERAAQDAARARHRSHDLFAARELHGASHRQRGDEPRVVDGLQRPGGPRMRRSIPTISSASASFRNLPACRPSDAFPSSSAASTSSDSSAAT